jgi:hypothetical protein
MDSISTKETKELERLNRIQTFHFVTERVIDTFIK